MISFAENAASACNAELRAPPRAPGGTHGNSRMKTYSARPRDIMRVWYVVDASDKVLGRLATGIAARLRGKHKAI